MSYYRNNGSKTFIRILLYMVGNSCLCSQRYFHSSFFSFFHTFLFSSFSSPLSPLSPLSLFLVFPLTFCLLLSSRSSLTIHSRNHQSRSPTYWRQMVQYLLLLLIYFYIVFFKIPFE